VIRPRLCTSAPIFLDLFQNLTVAILLVIGDVPIDCEASVVTSPILRICQLGLLEVLIEVELRVCRGEYACVCEHMHLYCVLKKNIRSIPVNTLNLYNPLCVERHGGVMEER